MKKIFPVFMVGWIIFNSNNCFASEYDENSYHPSSSRSHGVSDWDRAKGILEKIQPGEIQKAISTARAQKGSISPDIRKQAIQRLVEIHDALGFITNTDK